MTDRELLDIVICESGLKRGFIAEQLGLSYQGFLNKVNNRTPFTAKEIQIFKDLLNLPTERMMAIFFKPDVDK